MSTFLKVFFLISVISVSALAELQQDIEKIIATNQDCKKLGDFYWEIGTNKGKKISGQVGKTYNANTKMEIASASKWLFGVYAQEKTKGQLTEEQKEFLQMRSGYTNMANLPCVMGRVKTVKECFLAKARLKALFGKGSNAELSSENKGKFYYNGGHAQALAVKDEMGLADKTNETLAQVMQDTLKVSDIEYGFPQLAGGAKTTAHSYAQFLQNILNDKYYLAKNLQSEKGVCANKNCGSKEVLESPVPAELAWWYGNHYWIEKSSTDKVEAYSSPGLFGFYPWVTADKKYYGIIARKGPISERGIKSILCGRTIREKFLSEIK
ncbi:hypothetical protein CIK05_00205 [Bdellovibrio sp. qaytius]|nr:hypothetical protein CIK05_00205 [Bdellovibrio sp. qaytius]